MAGRECLVRELVVISGKGGTGKTSLTASLGVLAGDEVVVADADVDAADLHLLLDPRVVHREVFRGGHEAVIHPELCSACGACAGWCRFEAIVPSPRPDGTPGYAVDPAACEGCAVCVRHCPRYAIDFEERDCGEWFISATRCGPMVHARLRPGAENSGKLVSLVRAKAREVAEQQGRGLVLIDGSPGIGCPVIASLTNATAALLVAEPTVSGAHDLGRVVELAGRLGVPTWLCVNKWDVNPPLADHLEREASAREVRLAGRVRYDPAVTAAQMSARTIVEFSSDGAAEDIRAVWRAIRAAWAGDASESAS